MTFFDQPYYALTKAHMSRMGVWPEQSKYVRIILSSTMFGITLIFVGPVVAVVISVKLLLKKIKDHWEMCKNTTAVIDLDKYAERGCYITAVYMKKQFLIDDCLTLQTLINWEHAEVLIQQTLLVMGQVLHCYIIHIPGQELINRSEKLHTTAYNLEWQDMSANARNLLILILMRSNKPRFTVGKIYVMSTETFGSAIRIVVSYFMFFAQMI